MISFTVAGDPKGQPRPRAFARKMGGKFVARMYDAGTAEEWKGRIAAEANRQKPAELLTGPVSVVMHFMFRRPLGHFKGSKIENRLKPDAPIHHTSKPDCDNLEKAVLDCLTQCGTIWRDDAQVAEITTTKRYSTQPGVIVTIEALLA